MELSDAGSPSSGGLALVISSVDLGALGKMKLNRRPQPQREGHPQRGGDRDPQRGNMKCVLAPNGVAAVQAHILPSGFPTGFSHGAQPMAIAKEPHVRVVVLAVPSGSRRRVSENQNTRSAGRNRVALL
jgi:hypothetical protein